MKENRCPTKELIEKWGFNDITRAIVSTLETVQNQNSKPSSTLTKEDIVNIISNENKKLKGEIQEEMTSLKQTITHEARTYTKKVNEGLRIAFTKEMREMQKNLSKALATMENPQAFLMNDIELEGEPSNMLGSSKE